MRPCPKVPGDTNYFLGEYYTAAELAHDMKAVNPIINAQVEAIGPVVQYNNYTQAAYDFDHMSAYD